MDCKTNLTLDSSLFVLKVTEKMSVGITSMNCTSETFGSKTVDEIEQGDYSVLYVVRCFETDCNWSIGTLRMPRVNTYVCFF